MQVKNLATITTAATSDFIIIQDAAGTPGTPNKMTIANLAALMGVTSSSYTKYVATLTQSSTNNPVATVLENTIGNIIWTRTTTGYYSGTLNNAFTPGKCVVFTQTNNGGIYLINASFLSADAIQLQTASGGSSSDGVLNVASIEIRVYP